jgi:uncharacterized protein YaiI (UPF0178 family)
MRILIDADGCPVINAAVRLAREKNLECIIICDSSHIFEIAGVKTLTVSKGPDSVDFTLVNLMHAGDIVITQDYGLAAMCLSRKGIPVSQNGLVYDDSNMDALLFSRYASTKIRKSGGRIKGPSKRTSDQDLQFEATFKRLICENVTLE